MLKILELADIIKKNQLKQLPVYDFKNSKTLYGDLYNHIYDGDITDENELAIKMGFASKGDANYRKIKHRTYRHLRNTLFLVDFKKQDLGEYGRKFLELQKLMSLIEIVYGFNKNTIGLSLIKEAYSIVIELDSPLIQLQLVNKLITVEKHQFDTSDKQIGLLIKRLKNEMFLKKLNMKYENKEFDNTNDLKLVQALNLEELSLIAKSHYYILQIDYYFISKQYHKAKQLLEIAINQLNQKLIPSRRKTTLYNYQLVIGIQLKDVSFGEDAIKSLNHSIQLSIFNSFKILEYKSILYFHTKEYQSAYDSFIVFKLPTTITQGRHKNSKLLLEYHELIKAYLVFLKEAGKIKEPQESKGLGKVRVKRFVNTINELKKEKDTFYILVQVIMIALLIQSKKWDEVDTKIESFERYTYKYLKDKKFSRVKTFSKLLVELKKSGFQKEFLSKKTKTLEAKLKDISLADSSIAILTEYIPFEDMWEMLLKSVE